jgi:hypothetical protein
VNVGWDDRFLAPLLLNLLNPWIAVDEFQIARKSCNLQCKTDFGDSGIHKHQTFSHACPKGARRARGGQGRCPWGLWGSLWHPCGPFCVPLYSPWGPFGFPGSIWGLAKTLWGSPGGIEASNYIDKLPINRQSSQMLIEIHY